MKVQVEFFAQLRDLAGTPGSMVEIAPNGTVADLLEEIYRQTPTLRAQDKTILVGAGVEFVGRNHKIQPGESISIMPPVQGG